LAEAANVGPTVPEILSRWRNYGLFGTNIEGWFTLDPRNMDGILRAISLFGSVIWVQHISNQEERGDARVLCGFHRSLGVNTLEVRGGVDFDWLVKTGAEAYVVIPTILVETDFPSMQYIRYDTLETF
jgi:hypothetical protein